MCARPCTCQQPSRIQKQTGRRRSPTANNKRSATQKANRQQPIANSARRALTNLEHLANDDQQDDTIRDYAAQHIAGFHEDLVLLGHTNHLQHTADALARLAFDTPTGHPAKPTALLQLTRLAGKESPANKPGSTSLLTHLKPHIPNLLEQFHQHAHQQPIANSQKPTAAKGQTAGAAQKAPAGLTPHHITNLAPHLTPAQTQQAIQALTAYQSTSPSRLQRLAAQHALATLQP